MNERRTECEATHRNPKGHKIQECFGSTRLQVVVTALATLLTGAIDQYEAGKTSATPLPEAMEKMRHAAAMWVGQVEIVAPCKEAAEN